MTPSAQRQEGCRPNPTLAARDPPAEADGLGREGLSAQCDQCGVALDAVGGNDATVTEIVDAIEPDVESWVTAGTPERVYAGSVAKIDQFNYVTTLVITPMFLVAGTFFPIDQLREGFQVAAQFNPLYQLVELVRGAAFGFEAVDLIRVAVLAGFSFVMWRVAVHQMEKRLID